MSRTDLHPSTVRRHHWPLPDALRRGVEAVRLYLLHAPELAPVLIAGWIDTMNADIALLGGDERIATLDSQKSATTSVQAASAKGHDIVMLVRDVLVGQPTSEVLRKALGVGDGERPFETVRITAHLHAIVEHRAELAPLGVPSSVVDHASELLTTLDATLAQKSSATGSRHTSNEAHEAIHVRLEDNVKQLARRGALVFHADPATRELLRALMTHEGPAAPPAPPAPPAAPSTTPTS